MSDFSFDDYLLDYSKNPEAYQYYIDQKGCDWDPKDFDFISDKENYLRLEKENPRFCKLFNDLVGFLLVADGIVAEDLYYLIVDHLKEKENKAYHYIEVIALTKQCEMEAKHAETYTNAFKTIIPSRYHSSIIEEYKNNKHLLEKCEFIDKCTKKGSLGLKYLTMGAGEGIFFVSLFAIIFAFRNLKIFNHFVISNQMISRDETLHRDDKARKCKKYLKKEETEEAYNIIRECVRLEVESCKYMLLTPVISEIADKDMGLTVENLEIYVKMLADRYLQLCGLDTIYNEFIELKWMNDINLDKKDNFYEKRAVTYHQEVEKGEKINLEDDF